MSILQAISDIGLLRDINEDYAFCNSHPKNPNVTFLVLADGMGGEEQGDVASQEIVAALEAWFYHTDAGLLAGIDGVSPVLDKKVKEVNKYLIEKYGENFLGTTLTLALIGSEKTLFYNIGDSRGYIYKDKELIQITEDDSGVWTYYKYGDVEKDDLRFFPTNNFITACVGLNEEFCKSKSYIVKNNYEMVLLLTDGVTDILADKDIKKSLEKKRQKEILQHIITRAVHKDIKLKVPSSLKKKYKGRFTTPIHGRDNASGVIYIKD